MKLEIQIPYHVSLDVVYKMVELLDSVRKPSEDHAYTVIKLQPHDDGVCGTLPPYSTLTKDKQPNLELTIHKAIALVTPENCEYVFHIRKTGNGNTKKAWCGAEIHGFHFVDSEHAASNGANRGRLMSCLDCNQAIIGGLDNGWDEDHQPDKEEVEE